MKNEPAFPTLSSGQVGESTWRYEGLTKLEYFAGLAMQGMLSPESWKNNLGLSNEEFTAKRSVSFAKALIKQLENDI